MQITFTLNKKSHTLQLHGHETLLEVIRNIIGSTGTKEACGEGECGACTVFIDGKTILSCLTLACDCADCNITTIEGLSEGDNLHPIQEAFLEQGAVQCGFCMSGMILAAKNILDKNLSPDIDEIKKGLDGNLCRCAGYPKIFEAVKAAGINLKNKKQ
ncbi:MAG: (2Fe-2S)-binding protein [Candidatus Omnitrophica bacterium]|nr:(2Fe-2S)-binding protein [Candidatus Omnitrophota bacterium]